MVSNKKTQPLFDEHAVDAHLPEMNILRKLTSLAGSTSENVDSVFVLEAGPQADFCLFLFCRGIHLNLEA